MIPKLVDWLVGHTVWDLLGWVTYGVFLLAVVDFAWRTLVRKLRRGDGGEHAETGK